MAEEEGNRIARRLPEIDGDLQQLIQRWEAQNDATFRVFGCDFAAYIEQQKREYQQRKDRERSERASKKQNQPQHVIKFSARPVTPAKLRVPSAGLSAISYQLLALVNILVILDRKSTADRGSSLFLLGLEVLSTALVSLLPHSCFKMRSISIHYK